MPLYKEAFGISYVLRTMDIDFAVQLALQTEPRKSTLKRSLLILVIFLLSCGQAFADLPAKISLLSSLLIVRAEGMTSLYPS